MITTGQQAPDFELPDHDGTPVRLSELRGRPVVLYFYPKAEAIVSKSSIRSLEAWIAGWEADCGQAAVGRGLGIGTKLPSKTSFQLA
jgi:peroxiredoxin